MFPQKVGRYEILAELGRSDIVTVYKARDPQHDRFVILRAMRLDAEGPEAAVRLAGFREEVVRAENLDSPNLVSSYEHGDADGVFYVALEYVEGPSLQRLMEEGQSFSIGEILDISRQVCMALDHAQARGVISANMKPANFVLEADGNVKIMDFGIHETTGASLEALHYISPEQAQGERVDGRSNLFSWATILYELVTGVKAFPGEDDEEVRQAVMEQMPVPPQELNPSIPAGISKAIMRALAKAPAVRYAHGSEMLRDLESYKNSGRLDREENELPFMLRGHLRAGAPAAEGPATMDSPPIAAEATPVEVKPSFYFESVQAQPASFSAPAQTATGSFRAALPQPASLGTPTLGSAGEQNGAAWHHASAAPMAAAATEPTWSEPQMAGPDSPPQVPNQSSAASWPAPAQSAQAAPATVNPGAQAVPAIPRAVPANVNRVLKKKTAAAPPKRMLVYAMAAVIVALMAVLGLAATYIHNAHAPQPNLLQASPVANDPAFSEPWGDKPAQATANAQPVAFEIDKPVEKARPARRVAPVKVKTPPAVAQAGDIAVTSSPTGAVVQLDGRTDVSWATPCVIGGLQPGPHTVTISKPGFAAVTRPVLVSAGERAELSVPMAELAAQMTISSEPPGAQIFVDGKDTGHVTPAQIVVGRGSHSIVLKKAGFLESSTTAELAPGQVFRFDPAMKATGHVEEMRPAGTFTKLFGKGMPEGMGRVQIRSYPKGAQIMINNHMIDRPTPADVFLEPGSYELTLTMPGYKPFRRVFTVVKGDRVLIDETLPF